MELGKGGGTFLKKSFPLVAQNPPPPPSKKPHPSLSKDFCRYRIPIAIAACGQKTIGRIPFRGPQRRETAAEGSPSYSPVYKNL